MSKPTVAVIFGSRSAEHDISIITAINAIIRPLHAGDKYQPYPIYIAKDGRWFGGAQFANIDLYTSGRIDKVLAKTKPLSIEFGQGLQVSESGWRGSSTRIDVVFPATHGTYGEDGSLQGMLRMLNMPFAGCDMSASVLAMDKVLAKLIAETHQIPTPRMQFFSRDDFAIHGPEWIKAIEQRLKYPLFVKPAHLGSSIAIARVTDRDQLNNAIEVACQYDEKVLVEEAVPNLIEVTLPIMGLTDDPHAALLESPMTKSEEFFDFSTKYLQGGKKKMGGKGGTKGSQGYSQIPAKLPKELEDKAMAVGIGIYKALGCSGIARIDMLIDKKSKRVYFNEVNPLPGSLYAHNWQQAEVSNVELVEKLIDLAYEQHRRRTELSTTFDTNFLKQF